MVWGTATHISGNIGNIHMSMVFFLWTWQGMDGEKEMGEGFCILMQNLKLIDRHKDEKE